MSKIKILHLTDFHYSKKRSSITSQNRLVDSLSKSLKENKSDIDFIFFTGDLVDRGDSYEAFLDAKKNLLDRISKDLDVSIKNIFICAGNHDVNRGQELEDIAESIKSISNNDDLDNYVTKQKGKSLNASLENFNNYFKFQEYFYENHKKEGDIINKMYTIHKRNIRGFKLSITSINSAWRAIDSNTDSGNLLYPTSLLKESFEKVKGDNDFKFFLMHHPISDFKYWNSTIIESLIFKDYHAMFSGHTHKNRDTIHMVPEIGMYSCSSHATLSLDGESNIGYSVVEIDLDTYEIVTINYLYNLQEDAFYKGSPVYGKIPVSLEKEKENKFRSTIRSRFNSELIKANDLFLKNNQQKSGDDFLQIFSPPIIKNKPKVFGNTKNSSKKDKIKIYNLNEILESKENQVLFGKDKSGKTAILYKLLLDTLNNFSTLKTLPIYIDCQNHIRTSKPININKRIRTFYHLSKRNAEMLSRKYHIKIMLDNYHDNDNLIKKPLNDFLNNNPNSSIVVTSEETLVDTFANQIIEGHSFSNKFIWEIGRSEIRHLTNKWPNLNENQREVLLEKIHNVFKQLNIPSNYWTVSLFIWIFEKNADANCRNNFQLIELYIDNLLGKEHFITNESIYKIDYEDFKGYLGELAHYLITKKENTNYVLSHTELITFTDFYKKSNRKFVIEVSNITNLIIQLGILKKVYDDSYTFRLNGVFEYFLAFYMKDNEKFRNEIIEDGHFYLSFSNEFEICAGFNSRDINFVKKIYTKTREIFFDINSNYNFKKLDYHLKNEIEDKLKIDLRLPKILDENIKPIPYKNQDVIYDEVFGDDSKISAVKKKEYYETIEDNSKNLEKSLLILARVFRNSKFKNQDLEDDIFNFILNSSCTLGFQLIKEIEENKLELIKEFNSEEELMKMLIQFIPVVIQVFFYDAVVQNNLENILIQKIEELKKDPKENELKLLILYFSLIDLNLKNNNKYIEDIINILRIGVLKQTSLIKLYIYLATKVNNNTSLERTIQGYIRKQTFLIDDSSSSGDIDKNFSMITKEKFKKNYKKV